MDEKGEEVGMWRRRIMGLLGEARGREGTGDAGSGRSRRGAAEV